MRAGPSRGRTRIGAALVAMGLAAGGAACAAVLGIDARPLREAAVPEEASPSDAGGEGGDAPVKSCDGRPATGCLCGPRHAFCADFDDVATATDGWEYPTPSGAPIFLQGNASSKLSDGGTPPSPPYALETAASGTDRVSISILVNALSLEKLRPGAPFVGFRYRLAVRVLLATFGTPAGPLPGTGSGSIAGVFLGSSFGVQQKGVLLLIAESGMYVVASTDLIGKQAAGTTRQVTTSPSSEWLSMEIVVADRDRAVTEGHAKCSAEASGLVAGVRAPAGAACLSLPPELGNPTEWGKGFSVASGGLTFGDGNLAVLHDDVTVDFLE